MYDYGLCPKGISQNIEAENLRRLRITIMGHISRLSENSVRIDMYLPQSIKQHERNRRSKVTGINTNILQPNQPLPIGMDKFWAMTESKMQFQQFFITWIINNYTGNEPVYLGGSHLNELTHCMKLFDKEKSWERLLQCEHGEADDRMLFHVDHGIRMDKFQKVIVCSI